MHCHECAIRGHERPAVALCRSCLVALCHEHLAESVQSAPVAPSFGCHHAPGATARSPRARRAA
jgi:hypothetical protein